MRWLYPNGLKSDAATKAIIQNELLALGAFSKAEKRVFAIFLCTAALWITKDLLNKISPLKLDDNMIAIIGATALFITPSGKDNETLLNWSDTKNMAWGILLLFGGGIALAGALEKAGLIESLGKWIAGFGSSGGFGLTFVYHIV